MKTKLYESDMLALAGQRDCRIKGRIVVQETKAREYLESEAYKVDHLGLATSPQLQQQ